jgi:hypothetical protein
MTSRVIGVSGPGILRQEPRSRTATRMKRILPALAIPARLTRGKEHLLQILLLHILLHVVSLECLLALQETTFFYFVENTLYSVDFKPVTFKFDTCQDMWKRAEI